LWSTRANEVLFDGPAGTGKTRAVLEKLNLAAMKYPNMRGLILRATRASLNESILVTWEQKVLPPDSPVLRGPHRTHRSAYNYPNGSTIVVAGLDKVERTFSAEYDMIYIAEATEVAQDDLEKLRRCMRNGQMPYRQIILDCNPSYPGHWLKQMADQGKIKRILSRHTDNPSIDQEYLDILSSMTGHRRARLFLGQWVAAEGLIYDHWDEAKFVMQRPRDEIKRYIVAIDEGYTNPAALYVLGMDEDGRIHVCAETYRSGMLESEVVATAAAYHAEYDCESVVVDPSAAKLLAALANANLPTCPANNEIFGGIQAVQDRLVIAGDGRPRLTVDPSCTHMLQEFQSYSWKENRDGSRQDKPDKTNDHAMDALRYGVMYCQANSSSLEVYAL
jgi:phage terminase large subunit